MSIAVVTGSAGLIGSESVRLFAAKGFTVVGIDNDMRGRFFGAGASSDWNRQMLSAEIDNYVHVADDIRDIEAVERVFSEYGSGISVVIHTAAQPSHEWAARQPFTDFAVNAGGTLNLLEMTRKYSPESVFIFTSTNKVYGDTPNALPLVEKDTRWEIDAAHAFAEYGIDETMSIDQSTHSLFGASKVAADIMVQEYGRYFGMRTACFRGGCLTGPSHSGAQLHGFLAYLIKCAVTDKAYTVFGYGGKQVRDNMHASDLVSMFWHFFQSPRIGEVYNAGGGRFANCSVIEAIGLCEDLTGRKMDWSLAPDNRPGDHIWWVSDVRKFQGHYPDWSYRFGLRETMLTIHNRLARDGD